MSIINNSTHRIIILVSMSENNFNNLDLIQIKLNKVLSIKI